MNMSEDFERRASECELMAKLTRTRENRAVWIRLAERWLRCARLIDRQTSAVHDANLAKRDRAKRTAMPKPDHEG
jgi:hypothetical protein